LAYRYYREPAAAKAPFIGSQKPVFAARVQGEPRKSMIRPEHGAAVPAWKVVGLHDDDARKHGRKQLGVRVLGPIAEQRQHAGPGGGAARRPS
jgi:hypothetical protein